MGWCQMNNAFHKSAFSLVEVLFAMLILTVGMLMVSMQFPIGILNAQKAEDSAISQVYKDNALIQVELQLKAIINNPFVNVGGTLDLGNNNVKLHPMLKTNVYADNAENQSFPTLVIDDPEYFIYRSIVLGPQAPYLPFWSDPFQAQVRDDYFSITDKAEITTDHYFSTTMPSYVPYGDIGAMFCPPVGPTTPAVLDLLTLDWGYQVDHVDYSKFMEEAIYQVAMESDYSWAAFYCNNGSNAYDEDYIYLFILKHHQAGLRYAIQNPADAYVDIVVGTNDINLNGLPYPDFTDNWLSSQGTMLWPAVGNPAGPYAYGGVNSTADTDRLLPVPWRVYLDQVAISKTMYTYSTDNLYIPDGKSEAEIGPNQFSVRASVADVLLPGSYIIDADPTDKFMVAGAYGGTRPLTTGESGALYEVESVEADLNFGYDERYIVTLKDALVDDLFSFWVFPPDIIRDGDSGGYFSDRQPVVKVTKLKMTLQ